MRSARRAARRRRFFSRAARVLLTGAAAALCFAVPAPGALDSLAARHAPKGPRVSLSPILSWPQEPEAVAYELEFFTAYTPGLDPAAADARAVFRTSDVYRSEVNLPLDEIRGALPADRPLWWRVRALTLGGAPIRSFSALAPLYTDAALPRMNAPSPRPAPSSGRGAAMLYPVYSWVRPHGAARFEAAIYEQNPDEHPGAAPAAVRSSPIAELYDAEPRIGSWWWRVRAFGADGAPLGAWSDAVPVGLSARHYDIAVLGDSISHGGGRISYGPEDLAYSYLSYLDFSAVNLSQSGDTLRAMAERFERDVLPFSPRYLLVMGGTNDLRADGSSVEEAVASVEAIKEKCRAHDIRPIFLTLPPISPARIERVFGEASAPDWQARFAAFNARLREEPHIDVAAAFAPYAADGELPEWLGLDGLHEDILGKKLIAARVNADLAAAQNAADIRFAEAAAAENEPLRRPGGFP